MSKIRWSLVWGVFITACFFVLLALRLEFFNNKQEPKSIVPAIATLQPYDTWMNIYQGKNKIGVAHKTFTILDKSFHVTETVFMQINTMGVVQALDIATEGDFNRDMTLSSFDFDLKSSLFRFNAHGFVVKNKLVLFTGIPGAQQKSEMPLKDIPIMSGSIYDAAFRARMEKDSTRNFSIFDPSTLGMRSVRVTRNADEIIPVMGKRIFTQKYCADFMGVKNCAWLGNGGDILKETGLLGLSLEKVSREEAREGIVKDGSIDFTEIASVQSNVKIADPEKLGQLQLKITGLGGQSFYLNADRQIFRRNVLTITKEQLPVQQLPIADLPKEISTFLQPTVLIQSNNPLIKAQLKDIIKPSDLPEQKVRKIINWAYRNIEKKPVLSIPNALEVLKNKVGDCNEHAVLVTALLRAAGIPAQIETGLVYLRGRFYYHAWNIAYLGKWITADAVFNQFPADVTHIRLVRGEGSEQLDLMGVMGKIKLEVLEETK